VPVAHGGVSAGRVDVSPPAVAVATTAVAAVPGTGTSRWPVLLAALLVGTLATAARRTLRA
jgi:hypothetical protein